MPNSSPYIPMRIARWRGGRCRCAAPRISIQEVYCISVYDTARKTCGSLPVMHRTGSRRLLSSIAKRFVVLQGSKNILQVKFLSFSTRCFLSATLQFCSTTWQLRGIFPAQGSLPSTSPFAAPTIQLSLRKKMKLIWLCLVFGVAFTVRAAAEEENQDVEIEVLSKHEDCERQAKEGDLLVMHYTGFLAKDNTKFDSRWVYARSVACLIEWLIDWMIDWSFNWLIVPLSDRSIDRLISWLVGWLVGGLLGF